MENSVRAFHICTSRQDLILIRLIRKTQVDMTDRARAGVRVVRIFDPQDPDLARVIIALGMEEIAEKIGKAHRTQSDQ